MFLFICGKNNEIALDAHDTLSTLTTSFQNSKFFLLRFLSSMLFLLGFLSSMDLDQTLVWTLVPQSHFALQNVRLIVLSIILVKYSTALAFYDLLVLLFAQI